MFYPASSTVDDLRELIERSDTTPAATRLPVHPGLSTAFPSGLRAGSTYSLLGSTTMALALLAGPSRHGSWCAVVGLPDLGVEAAAEWGIDLDRLILVPDPAPQDWSTVVTSLIEVTDIVLAAPGRLTATELTRLESRLRTRRTTLVVTGSWPRAATVAVTTLGWDGLGRGHGALLRQHVRLDITERHQQRHVCLTLPLSDHGT